MIGIRISKGKNVKTAALKELVSSSETSQWKVHKTGELVATGANQIFTIEHGLGYTPAFLAFIRQTTFNSYYQLDLFGGANWIDKNTLSLQLINSGDKVTYIIFKDFGA